jgi:hypothetical protein
MIVHTLTHSVVVLFRQPKRTGYFMIFLRVTHSLPTTSPGGVQGHPLIMVADLSEWARAEWAVRSAVGE